ncbi:MAG TPA: DUF4232 domain-containing protein [Yinghuangia sp.]|nr:DUF4232 domain-containing protein [Yinghuangia sp.]
MFGKRRKAVLASAALVAGAMLMTACQDSDSSDAQGSSSSAPSADAVPASGSSSANQGSGQNTTAKESPGQSSGAKSSGGQGAAAGSGSGNTDTAGKCRTDDLTIRAIDHTITGDPEGSVAVELTNTSGQDCTLSGYAGVDLLTNAGTISAQRTGQQADTTTLKNGKSVAFAVTYPSNTSGGSGVRVTDLVVTPPDETKSVTLTWPGNSSLPVTDTPGSPVQVGPIGSAGQGG